MINRILKALVLAFLVFCSNSCTDSLIELNVNPNVSTGNINPKQLFGSILFGYLEQVDGSKSRFNAGFGVSGQWSQQFAIKNDIFGYYALDNGLFNRVWDEFYNISGSLRNVNELLKISEEADLRAYYAASIVLKIYMFSILTDLWGDIPYFDAGKADLEGNKFQMPAFDRQEAIYEDMILLLGKANELFADLRENEAVENDLLYDGDMVKWRKFANSLKLRLLVRISNKQDTWPQVAAIFSDPSNYPVFESIEDQANIKYDIDQAVYPPHWLNESQLRRDLLDRPSETMVHILIQTTTIDPRLFVFCEPTKQSSSTGGPLKYVGQPVGLVNDPVPSSERSMLGLSIRNLEIFWLQSYAELEFIRAEAQSRGSLTGNPAAAYQKGIQASFNSFGTNNQLESAYFSDLNNVLIR